MHYDYSINDIPNKKRTTRYLQPGDTYTPFGLDLIRVILQVTPIEPNNKDSCYITVLVNNHVRRHLVTLAYFWET